MKREECPTGPDCPSLSLPQSQRAQRQARGRHVVARGRDRPLALPAHDLRSTRSNKQALLSATAKEKGLRAQPATPPRTSERGRRKSKKATEPPSAKRKGTTAAAPPTKRQRTASKAGATSTTKTPTGGVEAISSIVPVIADIPECSNSRDAWLPPPRTSAGEVAAAKRLKREKELWQKRLENNPSCNRKW